MILKYHWTERNGRGNRYICQKTVTKMDVIGLKHTVTAFTINVGWLFFFILLPINPFRVIKRRIKFQNNSVSYKYRFLFTNISSSNNSV